LGVVRWCYLDVFTTRSSIVKLYQVRLEEMTSSINLTQDKIFILYLSLGETDDFSSMAVYCKQTGEVVAGFSSIRIYREMVYDTTRHVLLTLTEWNEISLYANFQQLVEEDKDLTECRVFVSKFENPDIVDKVNDLKIFHPEDVGYKTPYYYVLAIGVSYCFMATLDSTTHATLITQKLKICPELAVIHEQELCHCEAKFLPMDCDFILPFVIVESFDRYEVRQKSQRVFRGEIKLPKPDGRPASELKSSLHHIKTYKHEPIKEDSPRMCLDSYVGAGRVLDLVVTRTEQGM